MLIFFWQFFVKGLIPFPGEYLKAWYEPWKTQTMQNGVLGLPHKPIADDIFRHQYPMKVLALHLMSSGQLPLWNPYNGAGQPLLAMMHPGFLNPINMLFLFSPPQIAWGLLVALQTFVLGLSTYLFMRKLGLSKMASLIGSLALISSGFVIVRYLYTEFLYVFAGLPMLLYLFERYSENTSSKIKFLIPLVVGLLFFSGQPQMILYVLLTVFTYTLFRPKKRLLEFYSLIFLGICLAGIQLIPTSELFKAASIRETSSTFIFQRFLLPLSHLITIAIPNYFGSQATYNFWGRSDYVETAAFVGLLPCFFALISFFYRKQTKQKDIRLFLWIVTIVSIISTLDWFGTRLFFSLPIPILATGVPSRVFVLSSFALCILMGYGIDTWQRQERISKRLMVTTSMFLAVTGTLLAVTFLLFKMHASCPIVQIPDCRIIALRNSFFEILFFSFGLVCFLIGLFFKSRRVRLIASFGIFAIIFFVGFYNTNKFLPFTKTENVMPENSLLQALQDKTKSARYFTLGDAHIKADIATQYRIYDPEYFDPLYIRRYGELIAFANNGSLPSILPRSDVEIQNDATVSAALAVRRERVFDLLSVRYLVYHTQTNLCTSLTVWEDKNWCILSHASPPLKNIVTTSLIIPNQQEELQKLFSKDFNPQNEVILEEKPSTNGRLLVVSENYYPGWSAYVDGKPTKIYRANYTFQAIVLPKIYHTIEFRYYPLSLIIGAILSGISAVTILILFLFRAKNKQ